MMRSSRTCRLSGWAAPVRALVHNGAWEWPCGHVGDNWQCDLPVRANWHCQCVRCGGGQCRLPIMPTTSTSRGGRTLDRLLGPI